MTYIEFVSQLEQHGYTNKQIQALINREVGLEPSPLLPYTPDRLPNRNKDNQNKYKDLHNKQLGGKK